mmetsp:Transcript_23691/g.76375  ORF Transcript_23691/g.76375 Transcript_23691/m.76375 type:complete len:84 (+) Transcript_23691:428-679(+)
MARQAFLEHIGEKYHKTALQVLLRWAVQKNVSVIPGTGKPKHMRENLEIYDFILSAEDVAEIDGQQHSSALRALYTGIPDEDD